MEQRIGFVGIVLEEMQNAQLVNQIVGEYQALVKGRIGIPDPKNGVAVIGLVIEGNNQDISKMTSRLGNVKGVVIKSALTNKKTSEEM